MCLVVCSPIHTSRSFRIRMWFLTWGRSREQCHGRRGPLRSRTLDRLDKFSESVHHWGLTMVLPLSVRFYFLTFTAVSHACRKVHNAPTHRSGSRSHVLWSPHAMGGTVWSTSRSRPPVACQPRAPGPPCPAHGSSSPTCADVPTARCMLTPGTVLGTARSCRCDSVTIYCSSLCNPDLYDPLYYPWTVGLFPAFGYFK